MNMLYKPLELLNGRTAKRQETSISTLSTPLINRRQLYVIDDLIADPSTSSRRFFLRRTFLKENGRSPQNYFIYSIADTEVLAGWPLFESFIHSVRTVKDPPPSENGIYQNVLGICSTSRFSHTATSPMVWLCAKTRNDDNRDGQNLEGKHFPGSPMSI